MRFEYSEIRHVVKTERNYTLSFQYAAKHCVQEMSIKELAGGTGYIIHALIEHNSYENECMVHVDHKMRVLNYSCDCPFCSDVQGCAHIGALLLTINECQPTQFPFTYKYDEHTQVNTSYEEELRAYHEKIRSIQQQRQQRFLEEKKRREALELQEQEQQRLSYTHQLIHQEKAKLFQNLMVDHSGSVKLIIQYTRVNRTSYDYGIEFGLKIGKHKLYILKSITEFLEDISQKRHVVYGKELEFVHHRDAFDEDSQLIIDFLYKYREETQKQMRMIDRKRVHVTRGLLKEFFLLCDSLGEQYCDIDALTQSVPFQMHIHHHQDHVQLELSNYPKLNLGYCDDSGVYQVEEHEIIHLAYDEQGKLPRLLQSFRNFHGELLIESADIKLFAKYIWKDIKDYCLIQGDASIFEVDEMEALTLYGDMDDLGQLSLRLEGNLDGTIVYGFDDTIANKPRDLEIVEHYIRNFASVIDPTEHIAYLPHDDDSTYSFIKDGLPFLHEYCEIFISDAIEKLGSVHHVNVQTGVKLSDHLLEVSFDSTDISKDELFDVLRSYKRKRKYHRLKNGRLISLDAQELKEFDELVDTLHISNAQIKEGMVVLPSYRALSLTSLDTNTGIKVTHNSAYTQLLQDFKRKELDEFHIPKPYEGILRDYQMFGYQWLKLMNHYHFGAILADDMGLGKTLQVIALLESEKGQGTSIVITPSSLLLNWKDEIDKFTQNLKVLCIMGGIEHRAKLFQQINDYDVVITSYDYIRRDVEAYSEFEFHYIVLDEAQYIKNQKTMNAHAVKALHGRHKLALTGTPIENSLAELWSIFDFLMPDYLYPYSFFLQEYEKPIVKDHDEEKQMKLKKLVEPFILRRNKKDVLKELPDKVEHTLSIAFSEEEEKLYLANLMQVSKELQEKLKTGSMDKIQMLAMLTRLRQICCEPRLLYENVTTPSSKLKACMELCMSLRESGQKVLLFSSFTTVLDLLEQELYKYHFSYLKLTGQVSKEDRRLMVNQFQEGVADVFLISLKAGGTGLNLTAAEAVIHFDPWWNVSAQNQATDRAYRIGQEKNVQVFKLIMQDSIEEKIQRLQQRKKNLADTFVEHNEGSIASMDSEEILSLFQIDELLQSKAS